MLETSFYGIWHSQLGKVYCRHLPSMVTISLYQRSLKCILVDAWVFRPAPPVATSQYTIRCKIVKSVQSRPQSLRSPCTAWGKRRLWDNPSPEAFWLASYNMINLKFHVIWIGGEGIPGNFLTHGIPSLETLGNIMVLCPLLELKAIWYIS